MKKYIKNGVIITEGTSITFDGRFIINPREIDYASAGWEEYEEPEENLLAEAIASKINEIEAYDASDSVNGFTYGGNTLWFDAATRASYKSSIDSAELLGETELTIPTTVGAITLPLETAKSDARQDTTLCRRVLSRDTEPPCNRQAKRRCRKRGSLRLHRGLSKQIGIHSVMIHGIILTTFK